LAEAWRSLPTDSSWKTSAAFIIELNAAAGVDLPVKHEI
jgi:hypothetical protein